MKKRKLSFESYGDVIALIERLESQGYSKLGNWNLTQVSEHLTATMRAGMHGTIKLMPWLLRATILRVMFDRVIRTGHMPGGYKAPAELAPADRQEDDPAKIQECLAVMREVEAFPGPLPPHAFSTSMTLDKWKRLMLIHAAHHLGFLVPSGEEPAS